MMTEGRDWNERVADAERELQEANWEVRLQEAIQYENSARWADTNDSSNFRRAKARMIRAEVALEKVQAGRE